MLIEYPDLHGPVNPDLHGWCLLCYDFSFLFFFVQMQACGYSHFVFKFESDLWSIFCLFVLHMSMIMCLCVCVCAFIF